MSVGLAAVNDTVMYRSPADFDCAVIQTAGITTARDISVVVEATVDAGNTWFMVPVESIGRGVKITTIYSNGHWLVETGAFSAIRVRVIEVRTGTVSIDALPGEIIASTSELLGETSSEKPVTIAGSQNIGGTVQVAVTDIQKRRLEEALLLEERAERFASYDRNPSWGSEVR